MAIRKQQQLTVTNLTVRDLNGKANPFSSGIEAGLAENVIPYKGKIVRMAFAPPFDNSVGSGPWIIREFKFVRDGAPESQLLIFRNSGRITKRQGGYEQEIFPGKTSFAVLANKPAVEMIANRLHVDDGVQRLIYDGWEWCNAGLTAPAAPATALVAGALTGTYNVCVTAVVLRGSVRIHESSRSATATVSPAAQNIRVTQPTLDSRATHWSVYISEITGAGNRMRRAATVAITSATTDIAANPATTAPFAPERNDKPQASGILFQWKNRLGMGDRTNPENFWFTAFEEVKANLNGAPEESVPGRNGDTSISDLVNSWRLPDKGEALRAGIWHENFAFLFSDRNGYVVQGEGGLLDGRALRDFYPLKTFPFGVAGQSSLISTTHGLIIFTNDRHLYLWEGAGEVTDIGADIQKDLDAIPDNYLPNLEMVHWTGNGRDWLVFVGQYNSSGAAALIGSEQKVYFFDFAQSAQGHRGIWFHYRRNDTDTYSGVCVYRPSDQPYLLVGSQLLGNIYQLDTECQPASLSTGFKLGANYLGGSVQSSPTPLIRSSHYSPDPTRPIEAKYVMLMHRTKDDASEILTSIIASNPTVGAYYDHAALDAVAVPSPDATLTLGSRLPSQEQRAWFKKTTAASGVGVTAKRFTVELSWTGTDAASATTFNNNEILQFGIAWKPLSVLGQ